MDYKKLTVTLGALCFAAVIGGCSEEAAESSKASMQQATEAVKETAADVADSAGEAMEKAADKVDATIEKG